MKSFDECLQHMNQKTEELAERVHKASKNDITNPTLIRLLSRACMKENARFQVEEVAKIYTQACISEQSFEKFTEFVGLFYNTFLKKGFDILLSLQNEPCLSNEKRDYIDQWIFQRKSASKKAYQA